MNHRIIQSAAKLEELAQRFDNGDISFADLRRAEREIESVAASEAAWRRTFGGILLFLVGITAICYAFVPQYAISSSSYRHGSFIVDMRSGDFYACAPDSHGFACEKIAYKKQVAQ